MEPDQDPAGVIARKARLSKSTGVYRGPALPLGSAVHLAGWPTTTRDWKDGGNPDVNVEMNSLLGRVVWLAGWPTPKASGQDDNLEAFLVRQGRAKEKWPDKGMGMPLGPMAQLAGWPTPTVGNAMGSQSFEGLSATGKTPDGRKVAVSLGHVASIAGWPTPRAADAEKNVRTLEGSLSEITRKGSPQDLNMASVLTVWEDMPFRMGPERKENMGYAKWPHMPARLTAAGQMQIGFTAETVSGGQLSPDHSLWLMDIPSEWASCGVRAMQSMPKPPRSSSKRISKPKTPKPTSIFD